MNLYAIIILTTLLVGYLLDLITEILNLKALKDQLPEEFRDVFDAEKYSKSQEYTRNQTRFGLVVSTFNLAVMLIFWFSGGFNWLDRLVRQWELPIIWTGLIYIGLLLLGRTLLSLPFRIYSTFVIEEKFGFNKTTPKIFITDMVKAFLLSVLIGAPLLAGIMAFFQYAGSLAWVYAYLVTIIFTLVVQYIAPTYIMPLFNKFSPLEDEALKQTIFEYARKVDFPLKNVFVMDGSKRSAKSNAFFTGFGKHKRIALFDTLIANHSVGEILAILAHEIGHHKKRHILKGTVISIVQMGVMFFLLSIFISSPGLFQAFYMEHISVYAGLIFFGMLFAPIEMLLSVVMQIVSRRNEFEADRFAAQSTGNPENMINALKKLSAHNLSNLTPHPLYVFFHYSHPPVLQRIRTLHKLEREAYSKENV